MSKTLKHKRKIKNKRQYTIQNKIQNKNKKTVKLLRKKTNASRIKTAKRNVTQKIYTKKDYESGDGMLTSVWGPSLWHYLHTMSFNYPVNPTKQDKEKYMRFMRLLQFVLPCKYCRMNLKNNFKALPLTQSVMKNRNTFSKYLYDLHEHVNKMLGKKSGLSYKDVRERYEHFRSRCTIDDNSIQNIKNVIISPMKTGRKTRKNRSSSKNGRVNEKGCTEPLYGKKSKCIIKIVPQDTKCDTFQIDKSCIKHK